MNGTSSLKWITYSRHLRFASRASNIVVVASPEQASWVKNLNSEVVVILDDHSELLAEGSSKTSESEVFENTNTRSHIFWEGFGYNLKHFEFIAKDLDTFLYNSNWGMFVITDEIFARWGGFVGRIETKKVIKELFPMSWSSISVIPWSINNLKIYSQKSQIGIIPISPFDEFAQLKSENKLLSMWLLGLPVMFSDTPAYSRIASLANQEEACIRPDQWSDAMSKFTNTDGLDDLREGAKKYVEEFHTHDILISRWAQIFEELGRN
jgi:hypothetical protein